MSAWYILDRNDEPMPMEQLPERPEDARVDSGDPYTPWYKKEEHLHAEDGIIKGIHMQAESLDDARKSLNHFLENESLLISSFGGREDILIPDAERIIASAQ